MFHLKHSCAVCNLLPYILSSGQDPSTPSKSYLAHTFMGHREQILIINQEEVFGLEQFLFSDKQYNAGLQIFHLLIP